MLFNSYEFIFLFLPAIFVGFFLLGKYAAKSYAVLWLVIASFAFYGYWDCRYVPLLFASISFNYLVGRQIENTRSKKWLVFGIAVNVILLGYFKYTDFFLGTINNAVGFACFDLPHIVLPLGISFFTFTQTAYLADAYRGEAKNRSFLTYCEFVTIFPHLIAGPIINHKEMIPQFLADKTFKLNYHNIALGITVFVMGLFKKVVIADTLSPWVNDVFAHAGSVTLLEAWIGALAYTFQLYFDFSGYSEMAIGLGLLFNLKLPVNFNSPYQSTSMIDFWRRWHMTLGAWVRDYLYIPMGGNRNGELCKMKNLFLSMLIIGLWHGAGWTFIFWGAMHGALLMINHQWRRFHISLPKAINWGLTFFSVMLLWIFFRADNFYDAGKIIAAMTDIHALAFPAGGTFESLLRGFDVDFVNWTIQCSLAKSLAVLFLLFGIILKMKNPVVYAQNFEANKKWLVITLLLAFMALYKMNTYTEFLYFQF